MASAPKVGEYAPDFTAEGTGDRKYTLSDYRGRTVVLVFYPGDATPVCTEQLSSYSDDFSSFSDLDTDVLALSPQDVESHEAFSGSHGGFAFPLLYDEDKSIGRDYGILGPLGFYRRSIFVIDAKGIIRYAKRHTAGLTYEKTSDITAAIRKIETKIA